MVDGRTVMKTSDAWAEIRLREGDREITVYSFDRHGKGVYDTIQVSVRKGSVAAIPMLVIAGAVMSLLFVPGLLPRLRGTHDRLHDDEEEAT
jgi:hypothetical protein